MRRAAGWRWLGVATMAAVLAGACGVGAGDAVQQAARPAGEELSSSEVLAELRDSVALIETPAGSGSSVLLPDGYLLTNAHVVDPFAVVDVTFEGAETMDQVPVVGVDLVADLAVVGPISTDRPSATVIDPILLDPGSEVYLVGFPGDQREQEVTLASGVISRRRSAEPWGLEYLQTDTTIGGGQSGGALVDTSGRVVGISGLEDEDGFAYSLSGADVLGRLDDLLDGGERDWEPAPVGNQATEFTVAPDGDWPTALYLPHVDDDVELSVTVPAGTRVAFADPGYLRYPWQVNEAGEEVDDDAYWSAADATVDEGDGESTSGDVFAGSDAVVLILPPVEGGSVEVSTSLEMVEFDVSLAAESVAVGATRSGVLNRMDDWILYSLDLEAGESVEIAVRSANGDMAWDAFPQGTAVADIEDVQTTADDGGGGIFDLDAVETYTAESSGRHFLFVYNFDDTAVAYELTLTEA